MTERIVYMQVEDDMVTFEKENGNTIIYPKKLVPDSYKMGDIIKVIIQEDIECIDFIELDVEEMQNRQRKAAERKRKLRGRMIRRC